MARNYPARWRTAELYVQTTHAVLALCAFVLPVGRVMSQPGELAPSGVMAIALAGAVSVGGYLVLGADHGPSTGMVRWLHRGRGRCQLLAAIVVAAALGLLFVLPHERGNTMLVGGVPLAWALISCAWGPFWIAYGRLFVAVVVCIGISAAYTALTSRPWDLLAVLVGGVIAFGVLTQDSIHSLSIELDDLRAREAQRAVVIERKRFAGDLHDIQGQHLNLIAVEAQLVTRLISRGDNDGAAEHAKRIQAITLEALDDMHRVVSANRDVTLSEEAANGARVLEAAGISAHSETEVPPDLSTETDRLLGLTVREAVTNVLTHTRATGCRIVIASETRMGVPGITVRVADSGPAVASMNTEHTGTGIAALRERYGALGGDLTLTVGGGGELVGWIPLGNGVER